MKFSDPPLLPSLLSNWGITKLNSRLGKRAALQLPAPISIPPSQDFDGNDGPWSSFPIQIGSPPQTVKVLVSTAGSQTWAVLPQGCTQSDPANCSISRGGIFQPSNSSTWNQNQDAAGGLYPLLLEGNLNDTGETGTGLYGYDNVTLGGQGSNGPSLPQQVVAGIATKGSYLGLFGLSPNSSMLPGTSFLLPNFMSTLNQSRFIPSLSWSYTAGNQYRPGPVYGSLILGGYDTSRFEPNDVSFTFSGTDSRDPIVNIGEMVLTTNDFTTTLMTNNESIAAFIDSTTPYIYLPLNICQQFEEAFGITWDNDVQAYLVNDTLHTTLQEQDTSIVFNLGTPLTVPGQGFNISLPYAAFDLVAEAPLVKNSSRYFPLMRATNESQYTLGRTFLQEAYLISDYEHNNFSVSQCSWNSGAKSDIVPIKPFGYTTPHNPNELSPGAIAGIVVGAIIIIVIIIVFLGMMLKRKYSPKQPKQVNMAPVELDSPEKHPFMDKGSPLSPELDGAEHKGHELESSPYSEQEEPEANDERYELDATERRSRTLSSPISFMSGSSDATRLHQRQQSDPVSLTSELSDSAKGQQRELTEPVSPMKRRSDAARLHRSKISDPATLTNEGLHNDKGHERKLSEPISPSSESSDAAKGHKRELSDPVSLMSERSDEQIHLGNL